MNNNRIIYERIVHNDTSGDQFFLSIIFIIMKSNSFIYDVYLLMTIVIGGTEGV